MGVIISRSQGGLEWVVLISTNWIKKVKEEANIMNDRLSLKESDKKGNIIQSSTAGNEPGSK